MQNAEFRMQKGEGRDGRLTSGRSLHNALSRGGIHLSGRRRRGPAAGRMSGMSGRLHEVNFCKSCWYRVLMVITGRALRRPDKTGHFRTLGEVGGEWAVPPWRPTKTKFTTETLRHGGAPGRTMAPPCKWPQSGAFLVNVRLAEDG